MALVCAPQCKARAEAFKHIAAMSGTPHAVTSTLACACSMSAWVTNCHHTRFSAGVALSKEPFWHAQANASLARAYRLFRTMGPHHLYVLDLRSVSLDETLSLHAQANASLARAYRLFRTMGLHHLYVGPPKPLVLGVITRKARRPDSF